jgi:hypothetical protein
MGVQRILTEGTAFQHVSTEIPEIPRTSIQFESQKLLLAEVCLALARYGRYCSEISQLNSSPSPHTYSLEAVLRWLNPLQGRCPTSYLPAALFRGGKEIGRLHCLLGEVLHLVA